MLRRIDKRGDMPDLVVLVTMTLLLVAILVMFAVISAIVKEVAGDRSREKIYKDGEVGVGDLRNYMRNYNNLVDVFRRVRSGEDVDTAVAVESYSKAKEFHSSYRTVPYVWGVFYG